MRKLVFITGALSSSLFSFWYLCDMLHLKDAGYLILLSVLIFSFVFVPSAAVYYYKRGK